MHTLKCRAALALCTLLSASGLPAQELPARKASPPDAAAALPAEKEGELGKKDKEEKNWKSFLPEKGLGEWIVTDFGSQGKVKRDGESLVLEMGDPLTGVNLKKLGDFPKSDYVIELECKRVEGSDFLCGLTFPVGDEFCSFIAGGWGGGLVGLSSINGADASENSTSSYLGFDNGKWYKFRLQVDNEFVKAWIDEKETIRQEREFAEFSTRIEVYPSQPLGLCVFQSTVEVRNFRWRPLKQDAEAADAEKSKSKPTETR